MRNTDSSGGSLLQSERHQDAVTDVDQDCLLSGDVPQQIYLAQVGTLRVLDIGCCLSCLMRLSLCDIELVLG